MNDVEFIDDCDRLVELAPIAAAAIQYHVFVCTGKSCSANDSAEVKNAFERELKARGLQYGKVSKGCSPNGTVVLTECGSVGFCAVGAAVMVYPDGVWYAQVRATDVPEIVEEHIVNGRPVERLALLNVPNRTVREADKGKTVREADKSKTVREADESKTVGEADKSKTVREADESIKPGAQAPG